jgi:hypothetical protein
LEALEFLSRYEESSKAILQDAPRGLLTRPWRQLVERSSGKSGPRILTGFADEFAHISEGRGRVGDLTMRICAVLIGEACNIGLEPLVHPEIPALTAARLAWVQQNYIRAETLIRANARLVKAQAHIPQTKVWGGGEVASADELRFVVPVRTLHAGS